MKYLSAVIGFVLRFFGWLFVGTVTAATLYLIISMPLLFLKLKINFFIVSFVFPAFLVLALFFSWWQAHRSFWKKVPNQQKKAPARGLYVSSVGMCIGGLVLISVFLNSQFMTRGMGMVSWHKPKIGFFKPTGYVGPPIPKTAKNIYIEQAGWLDPYLLLRFEDEAIHLDTFAKLAKAPPKGGIFLPGEDAMLWSVLRNAAFNPRLAPFSNIESIKTGRSFLDEKHRRCLVIDDEKRTLYYFIW